MLAGQKVHLNCPATEIRAASRENSAGYNIFNELILLIKAFQNHITKLSKAKLH